MIRNDDNDRLAERRRTSICRSSVLNLGDNPRVAGRNDDEQAKKMPKKRKARQFKPSHTRVLSLLSRCVPLSLRLELQQCFSEQMKSPKTRDEECVVATPIRWIAGALEHMGYCVSKIRSIDEAYHKRGLHKHTSDFFLLDVIQNRTEDSEQDSVNRDPDEVGMALACEDGDMADAMDFKYRTMLAFLPGAGIFYDCCGRRDEKCGVAKSMVQLDMSWLRLTNSDLDQQLKFREDSYVKRFGSEGGGFVSGWKVSRSCSVNTLSREVYWAKQCSDADGPRMPPDFVCGTDISKWPVADRAREYNRHLVASNSTRVGGRHYALQSWHKTIPEDCLVIDGLVNCNVDIVVDVAPIGKCTCRKAIVMIRYILSPTQDSLCEGKAGRPLLVENLNVITLHNTLIRKRVGKGTARRNGGDRGNMHSLGIRVPLDGEGIEVVEYATNAKVPREFFRLFVKSLAIIGRTLFPDVLAVVQDTEGDSGVGEVASKGNPDDADDTERVGYTIDMSDGLENSSHYDTGDASQGFSVWNEEVPGLASNWYFVMPNLYGVDNDGRPFNGVAVKLRHGAAISWDGRVVRHCTSVTFPDGEETQCLLGETQNHVYGTFTAAKERIVNVGRRIAAALKRGRDGENEEDVASSNESKRVCVEKK